jgi:integrase
MRPVGPATLHRIRATLRKALNDAIRQQLITHNPAVHVELPPARRPKPVIWTDDHLTRWVQTGRAPSAVMVWTPEQTGEFLDSAAEDRLYPLYHLIALRGLRRGEACGLHWADLDLPARTLTVRWQLLQYGWATGLDDPKTDASADTIALDAATAAVLADHRARQQADRAAASPGWADTGLVFTTHQGRPAPRRRLRSGHPAGRRRRAAPGPAARPAARRGHPHPRRRRRHEDRLPTAAALLDHHHRRHLHLRAAPGRPRRPRETAALGPLAHSKQNHG